MKIRGKLYRIVNNTILDGITGYYPYNKEIKHTQYIKVERPVLLICVSAKDPMQARRAELLAELAEIEREAE
jgi:hypothetical protein